MTEASEDSQKWKDPQQNLLYQIKMQDPVSGTKYKLAKISNNGNKLEFICKSDKFPEKIDKNESDYCTYIRF